LASGEVTSSELLAQSLSRIDEVDGRVGAFTWLSDSAQDEAEVLDRELAAGQIRGPLHGIPIGVKELFDVVGAPATYGSLVLDPAPATADAEVVRRLRDAGAIIVGATRSHEFGWGITTQHATRGSTSNPWDLARVPGGSSGGSAAAVAAGMVPLAIASDTGGSIRIPAAFCGVAGIKPSYGRISKRGGVSLAPSLDTPGFIARSVADLYDALVIAAGLDPGDPSTVIAGLPALHDDRERTSLEGVRIGHSPYLFELATHTGRVSDYEAALSVAVELGAELVELELPRARQFRETFAIIQMADAVTVHRDVLRTFPERESRYGQDVLSRLNAASDVTVSQLLGAVAAARVLHAQLLLGLRSVDVLLSPVSTVAPPLTSDPDTAFDGNVEVPLREAVMGFTTPQNLTGLPTVAFPFGLSDDGLPVGFQITGRKGDEFCALRTAAKLERLPIRYEPIEESETP
jgi:aspartyl-tRNA(Asn)/glutamyl-tRNA(Gln) amidotransferase subunit A